MLQVNNDHSGLNTINDIYSLYIENVYIDSIHIENPNSNTYLGMNKDVLYSSTTRPIYTDAKYYYLFGNFKSNVFSIEIGKSIKEITLSEKGYGFKSLPKIGIKNAQKNWDLSLIPTGKYIPNIDKNNFRDAEFVKVLDYGGSGVSISTEINYGGTLDNLKEYIEFKNINNQLIMRFNAKYYTTSIYNLLFSNIATDDNFLYFTGSKLWTGYNQSPLMLSKIPNINNDDLVIKGILDYGGSGAQIKLQYDYGGKGGSFSITKNINLSNKNDSYYDVAITDAGIGFRNTENNISYLKATLIAYSKTNNFKTIILRQYNLNVNNGQISLFDNNYLISDISGDLS